MFTKYWIGSPNPSNTAKGLGGGMYDVSEDILLDVGGGKKRKHTSRKQKIVTPEFSTSVGADWGHPPVKKYGI